MQISVKLSSYIFSMASPNSILEYSVILIICLYRNCRAVLQKSLYMLIEHLKKSASSRSNMQFNLQDFQEELAARPVVVVLVTG